MKNVILTHKELQVNLFLAVFDGLSILDIAPDLWVVGEIGDERDFEVSIYHHPTREGCASQGKKVYSYLINKGEYQMNDVRLGVTVSYLREQAQEFIWDLRDLVEFNAGRKDKWIQKMNVWRDPVFFKENKIALFY